MRALLFLLACFCAVTLHAAGDQPKIDGKVGAVSSADIRAITAAAKGWLRQTPDLGKRNGDGLSSIHVVDHNKAEAHFGTRDAKTRGYFVETIITVRRVNGAWKADQNATVVGADSL